MQEIVVHLVHGTWPFGPFRWRNWKVFRGWFNSQVSWFDPNSEFCSTLKQEMNDQQVIIKFDPFEWSGDNSFIARVQAGRELREHLNQSCLNNKNAKHVIVAHSHGGTVAVHATSGTNQTNDNSANNHDHSTAKKLPIAGLITLATPFVFLRQNPNSLRKLPPIGSAPNLFISSIFAFWIVPLLVLIGVFLPLTWLSGLFVLASYCSILNLKSRGRAFQELMMEQPIRPNYSYPLVSLRAPKDEASLAIAFTLTIGPIVSKMSYVAIAILATMNLYVLSSLGYKSFNQLQLNHIETNWVLYCLYFTSVWLVAHFVAIAFLAFSTGKEMFDFAGFGQVQSEPLPPATTAMVEMIPLSHQDRSGFIHSIHEFQSCRERVAHWVGLVAGEPALMLKNSTLHH